MLLVFFLLWVVFNGSFTLEIGIFGIVISGVLFAFCCKFMDYSPKKELHLYKKSFLLVRYVAVLVREIIKANFDVIHLILSQEEEIQPKLVTFRTKLKTSTGKALLANAITLTPGTITVLLEKDQFTVHCLDESLAEGVSDSVFVDYIEKLEE